MHIVIFNVVPAIMILSVIIALHLAAILTGRPRRRRPVVVMSWRRPPIRPIPLTPRTGPRPGGGAAARPSQVVATR